LQAHSDNVLSGHNYLPSKGRNHSPSLGHFYFANLGHYHFGGTLSPVDYRASQQSEPHGIPTYQKNLRS
ncbi:MAG: hypothetical protein AB1744_13005, partial [Candidatus Zixiibacteriota bacterium]